MTICRPATEESRVFIPLFGFIKVKQSHYRPGQTQRVLRKLRFPDFVTTAQDGGRLSTLRTGRLYLQEILLVLISVRVDPRAIVRSEEFYVNEISNDSWDRTSEFGFMKYVILQHATSAVKYFQSAYLYGVAFEYTMSRTLGAVFHERVCVVTNSSAT